MFEAYKDVLTVEDLTEMLHVCKSSVYYLLQTRQLYSVRVGRKYLVPKNSVLLFLNESCYNAQQIINGRSDLVARGEKS
jgi:excisionase family DNA binding protein